MNKWSFSIAYFLCALLATMLFHSWLASEHNEIIAYSDFKRLAHEGKVLDAEIGDRWQESRRAPRCATESDYS